MSSTVHTLAGQEPSRKSLEQMQSIEQLRQLSGEEFEIGYINRIVPHHQGGIMTSQIMLDKAVHPELRQQLEKSIEEQQRDIELLSTYLRTTYSQEPALDPAFVMEPQMSQHLMSAPPESAEIIFLLMVREHHHTVIEMGQAVLQQANSQVLVDQATEMVQSQRQELDLFATFLSIWYGVEAPQVTGDAETAMQYAMSIT